MEYSQGTDPIAETGGEPPAAAVPLPGDNDADASTKRSSKRKAKPLQPFDPADLAKPATSAGGQDEEQAKKRRKADTAVTPATGAATAAFSEDAKPRSARKRPQASKTGALAEPLWSKRLRELAAVDIDVLVTLAKAVKQHGSDWSLVSVMTGRSPQDCKNLYATLCISRPPTFTAPDDEYLSKVSAFPFNFATLVQPYSQPDWWCPDSVARPVSASPSTLPPTDELEQNAFSLWAVTAVGKYPDEASLVQAWMALPAALKIEFVRHSRKEQSFKSLWSSMIKGNATG